MATWSPSYVWEQVLHDVQVWERSKQGPNFGQFVKVRVEWEREVWVRCELEVVNEGEVQARCLNGVWWNLVVTWIYFYMYVLVVYE